MSAQFTTATPNQFSSTAAFAREEPVLRDDDFAIDDEETMFGATPVYARTPKRKSGPSKAILLGVPVALVAAGAIAMFAMQPRDAVVADAAPAAPAAESMTSPTALATATAPDVAAPADQTTELAAADPVPAPVNAAPPARVSTTIPAATPAAPRREAPTRVARARPAETAASAEAASQDASAMLPGAPVPYSATTPNGAPAAPLFAPAPSTSAAPPPVVAPTTPPTVTAPVDPDPMAPEVAPIQ